MRSLFKLPKGARFQIALTVAVAGVLMSFVMVHWGGSLSRHLPDHGFHTAAFIGAGLAGLLFADGFGHIGRRGWVVSAVCFCAATLLGGPLGATLGLAFVLPFYESIQVASPGELISGSPTLLAFGLLAVLDGMLTSLAVLFIWSAGLVGIHLSAKRIQDRQRLIQSAASF